MSGGGRGSGEGGGEGGGACATLWEAAEAGADDATLLGAAVRALAAGAGWEARPGPEAFDFRGTFVRLWTLTR